MKKILLHDENKLKKINPETIAIFKLKHCTRMISGTPAQPC